MPEMNQAEKNKQASGRVDFIQTSIPGTEEFKQTMGFCAFSNTPPTAEQINHALLMEIRGMLQELLKREYARSK